MMKNFNLFICNFSVITCSVDNDELDYEMGTIEREEEVSKTTRNRCGSSIETYKL